MEEKEFDVNDSLRRIKEETVSEFVRNKLALESFNETQQGLIKGFIADAVELGYNLGEKAGMAQGSPETYSKIYDFFEKAVGGKSNVSDNDLKNHFMRMRLISQQQSSIVRFYEFMLDDIINKHTDLKPSLNHTALGVCGM